MSKCIGGVLSECCWKGGGPHRTLLSVKNIDIPCVLHTFAHYGFHKSRGGPNLFSTQIRTARTDLRAPTCSTKSFLNRRVPCGLAFLLRCVVIIVFTCFCANPPGTHRSKGSNLLNQIALKSPCTVRTCVFIKVCHDNCFYMFVCKSPRHGLI